LVAEAGVILSRVTQLKEKEGVEYVGIDAGMNSLIRPALYGSHHPIVNLTRIEQSAGLSVNIVGPICETGDTLGRQRPFPESLPEDIILIGTTGAYGRTMASHYNLRDPAIEVLLD